MAVDTQCAEMMFKNWHEYRCQSNGKIIEDGKRWCKIHAPSTKKAREEASNAKYEAQRKKWHNKWEAKRLKDEIAECAKRLVRSKAPGVYVQDFDTLRSLVDELEKVS